MVKATSDRGLNLLTVSFVLRRKVIASVCIRFKPSGPLGLNVVRVKGSFRAVII